MFNTRFMKAGVGSLVAGAMLLSACGDSSPAPKPLTAKELVALAKNDIAQKDYGAALTKCLKAEEKDDNLDEAKYCVLAAEMGALVQSVSAIIGLIASQVKKAPPAYAPAGFNVKSIINSVLSDIESQMQYIDRYSYKLAKMDNPHFQIDDFPLGLDPKDLMDLVNSDTITVKGELVLNMKGTWDKSEVMVLGATINAVQGVLDYLLAHKLVLATTPDSNTFDSTSGVAEFLHKNKDLLSPDTTDTARIKGDGGDKHKGLTNDVLAALSFLVGRAADKELVAPAGGGLTDAIKASAAESGTYADQVVKWVDADKDGIPEKVGLPALNALRSSILDEAGKPIIEKDTFDNPLKKATWEAIKAFGVKVLDNLENGGAAVGLKAPLQAIVDDLVTDPDVANYRLVLREVPDLIAINPNAFSKAPKYISELLPYYYSYNLTISTTLTVFDLAIEEERYEKSNGKAAYLNVAGFQNAVTQADWKHFDYPASGTFYVTPVTVMTAFKFPDFTTKPLRINEDAQKANKYTPHLYYIALQDPSIGGLLEVDTNFAGAFAPVADNAVFNTGVNKLLKYYCLDFNVTEALPEDQQEMLDVIDDLVYPADNKIAACSTHQ